SGMLTYAVLSQHFTAALAGRVNTALNLLVFIAAFAGQWGVGAVIDRWPPTPAGGYAAAGYRTAFGLLLVLQMSAAAWFWIAGGLRTRRKRSAADGRGGRVEREWERR